MIRNMAHKNQFEKEDSVTLDDGFLINYVQRGKGDTVTLLMPGALGTGRTDFTPQLEGLNSRGQMTLIAWDPPGYGGSRPPQRTWPNDPHFYSRDADKAIHFMSKLGHWEFNVVGWSDGAITSLIMAARYPEYIRRLVCLAGQAYLTAEDIKKLQAVADVQHWSERMRQPMEKIYGKDKFPLLWKEFIDACGKIYENNDGNICKELLPRVQCPTLIVHGDKDAMVADEHPEYLHKHIAGSMLQRFPDGKHNLHFKYKDEFNKLVEDFFLEDLPK